jgi:hypothetical protein
VTGLHQHGSVDERTNCGTSGWSFCSRLTAVHADTGDGWAASIRPGMGQFVASMQREMDVPEQVEAYLASQPEPKQADLRRLHAHILAEFPGCRLWFTDGTNADGKMRQPENLPAFCRVHRNDRPLIGVCELWSGRPAPGRSPGSGGTQGDQANG